MYIFISKPGRFCRLLGLFEIMSQNVFDDDRIHVVGIVVMMLPRFPGHPRATKDGFDILTVGGNLVLLSGLCIGVGMILELWLPYIILLRLTFNFRHG